MLVNLQQQNQVVYNNMNQQPDSQTVTPTQKHETKNLIQGLAQNLNNKSQPNMKPIKNKSLSAVRLIG